MIVLQKNVIKNQKLSELKNEEIRELKVKKRDNFILKCGELP